MDNDILQLKIAIKQLQDENKMIKEQFEKNCKELVTCKSELSQLKWSNKEKEQWIVKLKEKLTSSTDLLNKMGQERSDALFNSRTVQLQLDIANKSIENMHKSLIVSECEKYSTNNEVRRITLQNEEFQKNKAELISNNEIIQSRIAAIEENMNKLRHEQNILFDNDASISKEVLIKQITFLNEQLQAAINEKNEHEKQHVYYRAKAEQLEIYINQMNRDEELEFYRSKFTENNTKFQEFVQVLANYISTLEKLVKVA